MKPPVVSLHRIGLFARLAFLEARRQGSLLLLLVAAGVLVLGTRRLREFNFGSSERRFVFDLGSGIIFGFGSVLSAATSALLLSGESAVRASVTWLAKPVARGEFLIGRYLGALSVILCFSLITTGLLVAILRACPDVRADAAMESDELTGVVRFSEVAVAGFIHWLEFAVLAALTLLIASFTRSTAYAIAVSLMAWVVCLLQPWSGEPAISTPAIGPHLAQLMTWLVLDLRVFDAADLLCGSGSFRLATFAWLIADAALHIAGLMMLAVFSFGRRGN